MVQCSGYKEWTKPRAIPVDGIIDSFSDLRKAEAGANTDSRFGVWRWLVMSFIELGTCCVPSAAPHPVTVHKGTPSWCPCPTKVFCNLSFRSCRCCRCSPGCAPNTGYSECSTKKMPQAHSGFRCKEASFLSYTKVQLDPQVLFWPPSQNFLGIYSLPLSGIFLCPTRGPTSDTLYLVLRKPSSLSNLAYSKVRNIYLPILHGRLLWFTDLKNNY